MTETPIPDFLHEPLDPVAVRILGALAEKEFTTPDQYPLSLNALTAACNQTSNREPVMALDQEEVLDALQVLMGLNLVRDVHRSDSRVKRYRHRMTDTLHLHAAELATLCVLLLRGPQTVGEIKGRTARMVEFRDLAHVEVTLQSLSDLSVPLVVQLPRQPGQKEARYAQTLGGEPEAVAPPAPAASPGRPGGSRLDGLQEEVGTLRAELAELREQFEAFRREFR